MDLTGQTFNRWRVVAESHRVGSRWHWLCECVCGKRRIVDGVNLRNGLSKSCGCWRTAALKARATHRGSATPEYKIWTGMKRRCLNQAVRGFEHYGGRGITVCERWRDSFASFLEDMGPRPPRSSIERINNDGPYAPENCRWASRSEQLRNTRRNRHLTFNGRTQTLTEWARELGIKSQTLTKRLGRGWTIKAALTHGNLDDRSRLTNRYLEFRGERRCVAEWAKTTGIPDGAIRARLRMGWSVERALTTPVRG